MIKPLVNLESGTVVIGGWTFTFTPKDGDWIVKGSFRGAMKATEFSDIESVVEQARKAFKNELKNVKK